MLNIIIFGDMKRTIHHSWEYVVPTQLLKHMKCSRCNCEKFYTAGYRQVMFQDRFGKVHYRVPNCVLPNTKL